MNDPADWKEPTAEEQAVIDAADDAKPITIEFLKGIGFRNNVFQGEQKLRMPCNSPTGDTQWVELDDETNGIFLLCRFSIMYEDDPETPPDRFAVFASNRGKIRQILRLLGAGKQ